MQIAVRRAACAVLQSALPLVFWAGSAGCASPAPRNAEPTSPSDASASFAAKLSAGQTAGPAVRRLSARQYRNTLRDLFGNQRELHPLLAAAEKQVAQLPVDGLPTSPFPGVDARLGPRHLQAYLGVAEQISQLLENDLQLLSHFAGACAAAAELNDDCFRAFAQRVGRRILRRPLHPAEATQLLARAQRTSPPAKAYAEATGRWLASSDLFLLGARSSEQGMPGKQGQHYALAARLALHFWRAAPDEMLLDAAERGDLATAAGYRAQVERLTGQQRGRATWYRFFRQWLGLETFSGFASDASMKRFAGEVSPTRELFDDAVTEVEGLVRYHTFEHPGSYRELLVSTRILTRSRRLAALYGVAPWDGRSPPAAFPVGRRSGLLTRAALLMSGHHTTNPFKRGAFIRRRLLCGAVQPPAAAPAETFVLPAFDAARSTRSRYEDKVSDPSCKGCHLQFTPHGYALEAYDALGRFRKRERMIDDLGQETGAVDIDTRVRLSLGPGEVRELEGPVDLSRALAGSEATRSCLVKQYFRFTFQRVEGKQDNVVLEEMLDALKREGLLGLFRGVAWTGGFLAGGGGKGG